MEDIHTTDLDIIKGHLKKSNLTRLLLKKKEEVNFLEKLFNLSLMFLKKSKVELRLLQRVMIFV